ncbi:T9SS type A sorting domain-containing protein [candidate division WOR-3 bacterium]|nr:T9SS type A sorting domain-containing protein [candidate division WOR-3 bacterium]
MKLLIILGNCILISYPIYTATWTNGAKALGGANWETPYSIQQTSDSGYIAGGSDGGGNDTRVLIVKLTPAGNISWAKAFRLANYNTRARSIQQTLDRGYIIAAETWSSAGGPYDFMVMKLDSTGDTLWAKTFGGTNWECIYSARQTSDGGYIVVGETYSFGAGAADFLILKLDSTGNVVRAKTFGGISEDYASSVRQASDGNYIVAGCTSSFGVGRRDFAVVKLNPSCDVLWAKCFGGTGGDFAHSVEQTSDSGYIVAGFTESFGAGGYDFLIIKLTPEGDLSWAKTFGGTDWDYGFSVQQTFDSGYIVAGETRSFATEGHDFMVVKLTSTGDVSWAKTFFSNRIGISRPTSVQQIYDSSYIVVGVTTSFGAGSGDFLMLKIDPTGNMAQDCPWSDASVVTTTPTISVNSITEQAINCLLLTSSPTLTVNLPAIQITDVCGMAVEENTELMKNILLCFPNPATDYITIKYSVAKQNKTKELLIRDVAGREVKKFYLSDDKGKITWNVKNNVGKNLPKGIYFCTLKSDNTQTTKLIVIR